MKLEGINNRIFNSEKFQNILFSIENNKNIDVCGLVGSTKANIIYGIFEKINRKIFVISASNYEAKEMYENIRVYTDNCVYFQERENVFYNIEAFSSDLKFDRIIAFREVCSTENKIICTSIESLISLYMSNNNRFIKLDIDIYIIWSMNLKSL